MCVFVKAHVCMCVCVKWHECVTECVVFNMIGHIHVDV